MKAGDAREARSAVRLQSAHAARVLDVGKRKNGEPYMVMRYLDGQDLDEVIRRNGPMTPHKREKDATDALGKLLDARNYVLLETADDVRR